MNGGRHPASFRDPSGFIFWRDGRLFRQIEPSYAEHWEQLNASGLLDELVKDGLLVPHEVFPAGEGISESAVAVLAPERLPLLSHPYEWSFSQLKEAALLTMEIQVRALKRGWILKDASAYNVQFRRGQALFIDTLSFEPWDVGAPWVAYGQFCRHFLAPLALASYVDPRCIALLRNHVDGIPLDLAAAMMPRKAKWNMGLTMHLFAHARAVQNAGSGAAKSGKMSETATLALMGNLEATVMKLALPPQKTTWGEYYGDTNYLAEAMEAKGRLVADLVDRVQPKPHLAWDLGANDARFSMTLAERGIPTVAWDMDVMAVEHAFHRAKAAGKEMLPLVLDLTNPSPRIGWANEERASFLDRGPADLVTALALVHHLAIGNNVPLPMVAAFMARAGRWVIIEWVPKSDSQVQRMLSSRRDVFHDYQEEAFSAAMSDHFETVQRQPIPGSERVLYLFRRRDG